MYTRQSTYRFFLLSIIVLLASLIELSSGYNPAPRIDDKSGKFAAQTPGSKQEKQQLNSYNFNSNDVDTIDSNSYSPQEGKQPDEETRIIISEPYKSLIQTSARYAVAQTNIAKWISSDTVVDLMSDIGYALSRISTLLAVFKAAAIGGAILVASAFFLPGGLLVPGWIILQLAKVVDLIFRERHVLLEPLKEFEKYLPNGLNEMGIISILDGKTDELLSRFALDDGACREQTLCQVGEALRCYFPRLSKWTVELIQENFSRPKYRNSSKHLNAFLTGFVDQSCAARAASSKPAQHCANNFVKSLTNCPQQKKRSTASQEKSEYQTIRANRS